MLKPLVPLTALMLAASSAPAQELFFSQKAHPVPSTPAAVLESEVAIDLSLLRQPSAELALTMPDGNRYTAISTGFEQRLGGTTWRGYVPWPGLEMPAIATFTVHGDLVVATVSTPDGIYEIRPRPDRSHLLTKVDRSNLPDCAGAALTPDLEQPIPKSAGVAEPLTIVAGEEIIEKAQARLDVLAIYSAGARARFGGHSQIRARIQHAVDTANSAFINSGTRPRVALRHAQEMAISPSSFRDLSFLRNHPPTKNLRDSVGADLVAGFIDNATDWCGIGYLMTNVSSGFAPWAYSITDLRCSSLVFAHEVGHNLSLNHDPANAGSGGSSFPWAYGHFVDLRFRTVMSYRSECTNSQCPRVPHFSHPGKLYEGLPMGISGQRNNSRVLNVTGDVGASFRPARASIDAAFSYSPTPPAVDLPVQFSDQSTGSPDSWSWTFGDGASANQQNPTHVYSVPGIYTVQLTTSLGTSSDTVSSLIEIEDVGAGFEVAPISPRAGISTFFFDASTGLPDTWEWDFGDGSSSTDTNPTHVYESPGTYPVELTVSRAGRIDTLATEVEIRDRFCTAGHERRLCLDQGRFEVEVEWTDFQAETGSGTVAPQVSDDSGMFWFFDSDNLEILVKVLDGCGINDHFWVFAAATTNVEYRLRVTDTFSGEVRDFINPLGVSAAATTDIEAFATCNATAPSATPGQATPASATPASTTTASSPRFPASVDCQGGNTSLCLNGGRFQVEVDWRDFENQTGPGSTVFNLEDSGLFWFFSPDNWELLIKVLDGCGINGQYWVFAAATTNVEYNLRVTDTETGEVQIYRNPLGIASPAITDTGAFATCP